MIQDDEETKENIDAPRKPRLELCQCPFCGSLQLSLVYAHSGGLQVRCFKCHARGPNKQDPARAVVLWNRVWGWKFAPEGGVHARTYKLGAASKLLPCHGSHAMFHPAPPEAFKTGWTETKPEEGEDDPAGDSA